MNNDVQQGYDGGKFSEAYEKLVLKPLQEGEDFSVPNSEDVEPELDAEQANFELDEEQVRQFVSITTCRPFFQLTGRNRPISRVYRKAISKSCYGGIEVI